MKSVGVKVEEAVSAYRILEGAKYQQLSADETVKVWKISRQLKPVATQYKEDLEDAREKMAPEKDFIQKIQEAKLYEQMKSGKSSQEVSMSQEEYEKIANDFQQYKTLLEKVIRELLDKVVTLEIECISEDTFGKLMASNDWTLKEADSLSFIIDN